ncbi:MAG: hypothetical protein RLY86_2011 [Pseudomonadota bacterium]|jgi:hypothetical protein
MIDAGETGMTTEERLAVKALTQASTLLGKAAAESLCVQPDRRVIRALLAEARELLAAYEDTFPDAAA